MFRFSLSVFAFLLFFNVLQAQTETKPKPAARPTNQSLSPAEASLRKETNEVEGFARNLAALKTAFAAKDAGQIAAYEAYILRGMRTEADQMAEKAAAGVELAQTRLATMNQMMADFESHAFDPGKPEAAARDFAKLDDFLAMMQAELKAQSK